MDFDFVQPTNTAIGIQPGAVISGTVGGFADNGDDFILNWTGGSAIVDTEPLRANQLGLNLGEQVNVLVGEWDGTEIDTFSITRADGSAILGGTQIAQPLNPTMPIADPAIGSGFNTSDYLTRNPDVAAAGADPWQHFVRYGASEGRMPELFDRSFYESNNPDVVAAGADPWEHFVMYGAAEGRIGSGNPMYNPAMAQQIAAGARSLLAPLPVTPAPVATDPLTGMGMMTLTGTVVARTEPDSFLFDTGNGQILVDGIPEGEGAIAVNPGEPLTLVGDMDDDDFDAYTITRPDGSLVTPGGIQMNVTQTGGRSRNSNPGSEDSDFNYEFDANRFD
ncbi:hypothetical protein [Phormidium sp. CCY1219]|uniref:hypothetical protein n=1 Tax=Phormidium sp. CCY1219 TaxID=2886104 RepID=UPI002D1EDEE3|nr:hypothetical protein [Phormidium sp. CCY1219]MEB3831013.1 hypothetical protein [Phormidium sp. CCY1219]